MQTKLSKLKEYVSLGNNRAALKLAAGWEQLGEHKEAIERGWAAMQNPDFYRQIGKDPNELIKLGMEAIRERYQIERGTNGEQAKTNG